MPRQPTERKGKFFVYILRDRNGHYYTGFTKDIEERVKQHNTKNTSSAYTAGRAPFELVYAKEYKTMGKAVKAEIEIKSWTRKEKEDLIETYRKNK